MKNKIFTNLCLVIIYMFYMQLQKIIKNKEKIIISKFNEESFKQTCILITFHWQSHLIP